MSVARLYVAKRRAKPIVSADGSRSCQAAATSPSGAPRLRARRGGPHAHGLDERGAAVLVPSPELGGIGPVARARVQGPDLLRRPRGPVDAVRDGADRDLRERGVREDAAPEPARDLGVELRDAVDPRGEPEPEDRHRERLVRVLRDLAAEAEEVLERDPERLGLPLEVALHDVPREEVDPRRHRRVRREDVSRRRDLARLGERERRARRAAGGSAPGRETRRAPRSRGARWASGRRSRARACRRSRERAPGGSACPGRRRRDGS